MSAAPTWECQRSVDVDVPVSFAWAYMTDIRNWNDPPAEFALEGPFADGTRGTTRVPGQPLTSWTVRGVEPGRGYTIESGPSLERAVLLAHWRFDPLSERTARLTQRMELSARTPPPMSTRSSRHSSRTWSPGCDGSRR